MKDAILTPEARHFLSEIQRRFNPERQKLLSARAVRQKELENGRSPTFLKETEAIRNDLSWKIAPPASDLKKRWCEITGPTESKMMVNALNSGADVFMADFEDSLAPAWHNILQGQTNLIEAVDKTLTFKNLEGRLYQLNPHTATLMVRPRGFHLEEKNFLVDGKPIAAAFFDFGLAFFHNAKKLLEQGSGPYFYLPKLENRMEARLWNELFIFSQESLAIQQGSIRATVLIETILAAFEMEEIMYELKEHLSGLNAGRWDYIFSIVKKFCWDKRFLFPDRSQIGMEVPFMKTYSDLLVHTCHKRGTHAIGGMSAFIPSRKDPIINNSALKKVREDKFREASSGFDGTWVAHPDLVPIARTIFEEALKGKSDQKFRKREDVTPSAVALLHFEITNGTISEEGFRQNISVALLYLTSWLRGTGAVALFNLMEDAATAEICRAQLWQWVHHPSAALRDGREITALLYTGIAEEETAKIKKNLEQKHVSTLESARQLLDQLVLSDLFEEFLTLAAYERL